MKLPKWAEYLTGAAIILVVGYFFIGFFTGDGLMRDQQAATARVLEVQDKLEAEQKKSDAEKDRVEGAIRAAEVQEKSFKAGEDVVLRGGKGYIYVSPTAEDWAELGRRAARRDEAGIQQLMTSDRLLACAQGAKATFLKVGFEAHEIRILEGKHAGRSGFVQTDLVHKP